MLLCVQPSYSVCCVSQLASHGHFTRCAASAGTLSAVPYVLASHGALCMQCNSCGALSMQCSSYVHFQCTEALMGTFNAVQLSWALYNGVHVGSKAEITEHVSDASCTLNAVAVEVDVWMLRQLCSSSSKERSEWCRSK